MAQPDPDPTVIPLKPPLTQAIKGGVGVGDDQLNAFAHPLQRRRFILALVFALILFPLIGLGIIVGTIFLVVPVIAFLIWMSGRVLFSWYLGNSILVSNINYPRINTIAEELKVAIGYQHPVYIFVYEHANFNAYLAKFFFFRRAIFLNSELLETGVSDDEVRWLIGRFIGYWRARRHAGFFGWIIRAAQHLLIFNVFLLPYERALVYTGDRLALAVIEGDVSSAISAMQKLLVGRQLGYSVNPEGMIEQQRQVKGSVFALLARLMTTFPHLTSRYVDLIVFAKAYFPAQFVKFEAANPGLPVDLQRLTASPQPNSGPLPQGAKTAGGSPQRVGWLVLAGIAAAVAIPSIVWIAATPDRGPAETVPAPIAARPSATLPPHVHIDASGQLAPDNGCVWVSPAPQDLRVRCN
jgi:hypothetical protein